MHRVARLLLLSSTVLAIAVGGERESRAQTTTPTGTGATVTVNDVVIRKKPDGSAPTAHPQSVPTTAVTGQDCKEDVQLTFSLALGGISASNHLEVWAGGADCSDYTQRSGTTARCWPVVPAGGITISASTQAVVRVRDIASQMSAQTKNLNYTPAGADACTVQTSTGKVDLTLSFIWVDGAGQTQGGATKGVSVDMVGPEPPTEVKVAGGDRVLVVSWKPPSSAGSDITGFNIYCAPASEAAAAGGLDSGSTSTSTTRLQCADGGFEDGGFDDAGIALPGNPIDGGCITISDNDSGASTVDPTCPSPPLTVCGTAGGVTSSSTTIADKSNGTRYAVAVAGIDAYGNAGKLSIPSCDSPGPVLDFFHAYKEAGGGAGGCAVGGPGDPRPPEGTGNVALMVIAAWGAAAVVFGVVRKRRSR